MKKISILLANLLCATMIIAAPTFTGKSQINLSTTGQTDKIVRFLLSDQFSDAFDNSWDAVAANEGGIYVFNNNERYTTWASNAYSENLQLGFGAGENTDYVLKFSNFEGVEYQLFDLATQTTITVNASTPDYPFTIDAADKNKAINNRFIINFNPAPSICFRYNELQVLGYAGKSLVVKDKNGTEIVNIPSLGIAYFKDLSDKHGRLIVVLDGKEIQIDATPDVTPAN